MRRLLLRAAALLFLALLGLLLLRHRESAPAAPEAAVRAPAVGPPPAAAPPRPPAAPADAKPPREAAPETTLLLEVRQEDGGPVPGARIAVFAAGEVLASGRTDAGGRYALAEAPGGPGTVLVLAPSQAPFASPLPLEPGRRELVLPVSPALAGVVVLGEGASAELPAIRLLSRRVAEAVAGIPEELLQAAGVDPGALDETTLDLDPGNRFRVAGLPPGWSGRLVLPRGWVFAERPDEVDHWDGRFLSLPEPREDLVLHVSRLPVVRGRVLLAGGGEQPRPDCSVGLAWVLAANPGSSPMAMARTDAAGRFAIPIPTGELLELRLTAWPADMPPWTAAWKAGEIPGDLDLGDLRLPAGRAVAFQVLAPTGAPLAGAQAWYEGRKSAPTGPDGRGRMGGLPQETFTLAFAAPGRVPARVEVPPGADSLPSVVLQPATRLVLRVRLPGGAPWTGRVELRSAAALGVEAIEDLGWNLRWLLEGDAWPADAVSTRGPQGESLRLGIGPEGVLALTRLRPGTAFTVRVLPDAGPPLLEREIAPLLEAEEREVELVLPAPPRTLAGRVTDEEGRPLAGARLLLSWGDEPRFRSLTTGPDGAFTVGTVSGEGLRLEVRLEGFVPLVEPEYRLPPPGEPALLRLRRGHEVLVEVVDADGAPVAADRVRAELASGVSLDGERVAANVFRLRGLPAEEVVIEVRAGDHTWRQRHVGSTPRAVVVVPAAE